MDGSSLPPPWGSRSVFLSTMLFVVLLVLSLPSTVTAQANQPTTPTVDFVSQTLRPLLEMALSSSLDSDSSSLKLQQQIEADAKQKTLDDTQRKKEQQDSATAYALLFARAGTLQSYFDALSSKLTDFSGSEDQKQAAALAAVDKIKDDAKALAGWNTFWKVTTVAGGLGTILALIWAAVK
jgi:hypothetical protein